MKTILYGSARPNVLGEVAWALLLITGGTAIALIQAAVSPRISIAAATLQVQGLCCTHVADQAAERLLAVDGVLAVRPDFRERRLAVHLRGDRPPSARQLWEAIEHTSVLPTRLVMDRTAYDTKPLE